MGVGVLYLYRADHLLATGAHWVGGLRGCPSVFWNPVPISWFKNRRQSPASGQDEETGTGPTFPSETSYTPDRTMTVVLDTGRRGVKDRDLQKVGGTGGEPEDRTVFGPGRSCQAAGQEGPEAPGLRGARRSWGSPS